MSAVLELQQIDHVALNVSDIDRSIAWYREVLGLERRHEEAWGQSPAMVCAGDTCVALFEADADDPSPPPGPETLTMRHLAFRVDRENFERARAELDRRGIATRFRDHGITHSTYLHDPDGHLLEITTPEL